MHKLKEVWKYQALLKHAEISGNPLWEELDFQRKILLSLGLSEAAILNQVHDKYARYKITIVNRTQYPRH